MVRSIKKRAPQELQSLRKRTLRILALGRISKEDADRVLRKISDLEEVIQHIDEKEEGN